MEDGSIQVLDRNMPRLFKLISLILLLTGCNEQFSEGDVDLDSDFFPLKIGQFRTYEVTEINYNAQGSDTSTYLLRETINDTIRNGDEVTYLIKREFRTNETFEWSIKDIWSCRKTVSHVVITEENIPFVKLVFPVLVGETWDGNAFNTLNSGDYYYESLSENHYEELISENDLIKVVIADIPQNLVNQDQRYEVYGRGIGLIEKDYTILEFCTTNCSSEQIDDGMKLKQVLVDYGEV